MKLYKVSWIPTVILGAIAVGPFIVETIQKHTGDKVEYGPEVIVLPIAAILFYLALSIFGKGKE